MAIPSLMLPAHWHHDFQSNLLQQLFPAFPCIVASFFVGLVGIWRFPGTHEAVACAVVDHWLIGLAGLLHQLFGLGNSGIDAIISLAIKAVYRTGDSFQGALINVSSLGRRRAVKDISSLDVLIVGGKTECLAATPAEATHNNLTIAGRQFGDVPGHRIEVCGNLLRRYLADRFTQVLEIFAL